jgi:hypothetical protein
MTHDEWNRVGSPPPGGEPEPGSKPYALVRQLVGW